MALFVFTENPNGHVEVLPQNECLITAKFIDFDGSVATFAIQPYRRLATETVFGISVNINCPVIFHSVEPKFDTC